MSVFQWCFVVFIFGLAIGWVLRGWVARKERSSGTIYVTHDQEKTLYSLELTDYPETIEFKKKVVFKVEAPEENLTRE